MGLQREKRRKPETLYNLEVKTLKLPAFAYTKKHVILILGCPSDRVFT